VYDRIICDVPCGGDGTLRKNPEVWQRWHPEFGIGLHPLQLRIALRGAALLKVGGLMCYSTCSFNPIENEAVVAELLRRCKGALVLEDASALLPQLQRSPGLRKWRVMDDSLTEYATYADAQASSVPPYLRRRFRRSMWPPEAGRAPPPLHRCARLLPQLHDTGGFFVALLRKIAPLPHGRKASPSARASAARQPPLPRPPQNEAHVLTSVATSAPAAEAMREWFGLDPSAFKTRFSGRLFTRSARHNRTVMSLSPELAAHLTAEAGSERLRLVGAGVRLLERPPGKALACGQAHHRLSPEAVPILAPLKPRRQCLTLSKTDLETLLEYPNNPVGLSYLTPQGSGVLQRAQVGQCLLAVGSVTVAGVLLGRELPTAVMVYFSSAPGREHAPRAAAAYIRHMLSIAERAQAEPELEPAQSRGKRRRREYEAAEQAQAQAEAEAEAAALEEIPPEPLAPARAAAVNFFSRRALAT